MRKEGAVEMRTLEGEREKEKDDVEMKKSTRLGGEKGSNPSVTYVTSPLSGATRAPPPVTATP